PWLISTAAQLDYVRNYLGTTHSNKYFIQTADIDLGLPPWNTGAGWVPIGSSSTSSFRGNYNGGGYTITGLTINRPTSDYQGLFGYTSGAPITDLGLANVSIIARSYTGAIVGRLSSGTINNCFSTGNVICNASYIGGLVGYQDQGTITNSSSNSRINGNSYVGGLVGIQSQGTITGSHSVGSINGSGNRIGGFVGSSSGVIDNCFSSSLVTGGSNVGGLVGYLSSGSINKCYSTGIVTGNSVIGGLTGYNSGSVTNSYWDINSSGQSTSAGGEGRTTLEMTYPYAANTYLDWDFSNVWTGTNGYPYHQMMQAGITAVPLTAGNPTPFNLSSSVNCQTQFSWSGGDGAIGFKLFLGSDNPPTNVYNGLDLGWRFNYIISDVLENSSVYYWQIIPYNSLGDAINCPVWSYTTHILKGSGTLSDPLQVSTAAQLDYVRNYLGTTHSNKYFIQTADIDLGLPPWNTGAGWVPIGSSSTSSFRGNYNGNGYSISGLTISRPTSDYQGLFGYTFGATIHGLSIYNANVNARNYAGSLAGYQDQGNISNCFSSANTTGSSYVGGLVGYQISATMSNCYSAGTIRGNSYVGGLLGYKSEGFINNCYSTGNVTGSSNRGGLLGFNSGSVTNSYWDVNTSGQGNSAGGEGRTTIEMTYPYATNTYEGWDFSNVWTGSNGYPFHQWMQSGITAIPLAASYPTPSDLSNSIDCLINLSWNGNKGTHGFRLYLGTNNPPTNVYNSIELGLRFNYMPGIYLEESTTYYWKIIPYNQLGEAEDSQVWSFNTHYTISDPDPIPIGSGTESDPWQISTAIQLDYVRNYLGASNSDKYFIQTADIDLGVSPWTEGGGWIPIGSSNTNSFCGRYNGNGFTISGLTINRPSSDNQGLFGYTVDAILSNLSLVNVCIDAGNYTGSLTGYMRMGSSTNCSSSGTVNGGSNVGGLVGCQEYGNIIESFFTGSVTGNGYYYIGGLVGSSYGNISKSFSNGLVSGNDQIGGLIGRLHMGTIDNCFSSGSVIGDNGGGLVGFQEGGIIEYCYTTSNVQAGGGLVGLQGQSGCSVFNSWWDIDTTGQDTSAGGEGRTTVEMTYPYASNTYVGWDFNNIWSANNGYPYLIFMNSFMTYIPRAVNYQTPFNQSVYLFGSSTLKWDGGSAAYGYKLYLGTDNPPTNLFNGTDVGWRFQYSPDQYLANGTTYFWKIVPYNSVGYAMNCPVWSFSVVIVDTFAGGSGSYSNPWQVANAYQLNLMRNYVGSIHSDKHFIQTADIDLGVLPWIDGSGWVPISPFCGKYNGNGYTISGLTINRPSADYQGLFGVASNAVISNLGLTNVNVYTQGYAGSLVGYQEYGTINNCYSIGGVRGGGSYIGGLIGRMSHGIINTSHSTGRVAGSYNVGGVVGLLSYGSLSNSFSMARVEGGVNVGGLAGYNISGSISSCYSTGCVSSIGANISYIGGLLGSNSGVVTNSYWDVNTSGQVTSAGGEGRTIIEMTYPFAANTYVGWDFSNLWTGSNGYPYLQYMLTGITSIPSIASTPSPSDQSHYSIMNTLLGWGGAARAIGFKLWLGTDNPPTNIANGMDLGWRWSYDPNPNLVSNTTYYWRIIPYNMVGDAQNCPIWSFSAYDATLLYPQGGELWQSGTTKTIRWDDNIPDQLNVFISFDNGNQWHFMAETDGKKGYYHYQVPSIESSTCEIKIVSKTNPNQYDINDLPFRITYSSTTPKVLLTAPNATGIFLQSGQNVTIGWIRQDVGLVALDYSKDDGLTWVQIISGLSGDSYD
ncbi:MAG TPA: GLUG motif-containing protein, partial [Candidatus Cloacimonadota bacterium]|nr:GLUG motif-containing protein [Candidatus Cloacimonadota bacterium]